MTNFVPYEIIINDDKYFPWISNRIKKLIHKRTIFVRIITKMMTLFTGETTTGFGEIDGYLLRKVIN